MPFQKILIADDAPHARKMLNNIVQELGHTKTVLAVDGQEALDILNKENDFDLIISDWVMPRMTGIEFLKAVKSNDNTRHIPFLMVSSLSSKTDIMDAIENGAVNYITKPYDSENVKEKITEIDL